MVVVVEYHSCPTVKIKSAAPHHWPTNHLKIREQRSIPSEYQRSILTYGGHSFPQKSEVKNNFALNL